MLSGYTVSSSTGYTHRPLIHLKWGIVKIGKSSESCGIIREFHELMSRPILRKVNLNGPAVQVFVS